MRITVTNKPNTNISPLTPLLSKRGGLIKITPVNWGLFSSLVFPLLFRRGLGRGLLFNDYRDGFRGDGIL